MLHSVESLTKVNTGILVWVESGYGVRAPLQPAHTHTGLS